MALVREATGAEGSALAADARGILDPARLADLAHFERFDPPEELAGLIEWTWAIGWRLPPGLRHRQQVLSHPGLNLSVGEAPPEGTEPPEPPWPLRAEVYGVPRDLTTRVLSGAGWNVAARTTVGGFGAFWAHPVADLTDAVLAMAEVLGFGDDLAERVRAAGDDDPRASQQARAETLVSGLSRALLPERVATAREVAAIARHAETDRSMSRAADLAATAGVGVRTLQRLFAEYAGVSPTWVIRRYRLIDAAERVRDGCAPDWAGLAADLGYADQAHLIRDFRATLGTTPAAYAEAQLVFSSARRVSG